MPEVDPLTRDIASLRALLDAAVPPKALDRNLLIATWNIKAFGRITPKWDATDRDTPKRDLRALRLIAEIVGRFDVIAIQELLADLSGVRALIELLGPNWGLIATDVTRGSAGNNERLGFIYDRRRVVPSGLAAELVVPVEEAGVSAGAFDRQFARTPYAVSFDAGGTEFILITLHVLYGSSSKARIPELRAIAEWLGDWARSPRGWHPNLIALGDFNIDRMDDDLYRAFVGSGLQVPTELMTAPRSIFGAGKFYDQVAWFGERATPASPPALSMEYVTAGFVDFPQAVYPDLTRAQVQWRMSDHYPLWTEFRGPDLRSGLSSRPSMA